MVAFIDYIFVALFLVVSFLYIKQNPLVLDDLRVNIKRENELNNIETYIVTNRIKALKNL